MANHSSFSSRFASWSSQHFNAGSSHFESTFTFSQEAGGDDGDDEVTHISVTIVDGEVKVDIGGSGRGRDGTRA
jgi:hypothetical protein